LWMAGTVANRPIEVLMPVIPIVCVALILALGIEVDVTESNAYLMLFEDGNRIDLRLVTLTKMLEQYGKDSLTVPLLDKDGRLKEIPKATDESYWIKEPSEAEYFSCCNNFLWCVQNVAKGLCRDELPYAKQMFEVIVRADLHQMSLSLTGWSN